MSHPRGWDGFRIAIVAVAIGVCAGVAQAAPISLTGAASPDSPPRAFGYSTTASVGRTGIDGQSVVTLRGIEHGTLYGPYTYTDTGGYSPIPEDPLHLFYFPLGEFQFTSLPVGASTRYVNTPFSIELKVEDAQPIVFVGRLDGIVAGQASIDLTATIETTGLSKISLPFRDDYFGGSFRTDDFTSNLAVSTGPFLLEASSSIEGRNIAHALIFPVPELTSFAVYLTAALGLGWQRSRSTWRRPVESHGRPRSSS